MRRNILAGSATLLLVSAVVIYFWWPEAEIPLACCWRGGAILAAAWLAFDDVQRLPNWLLLLMPVLFIVLVRWARLLWLIIPALIVWAIVRQILWPESSKGRR